MLAFQHSRRTFLQTAAAGAVGLCQLARGAEPEAKKIRLALVTGGHPFSEKGFFGIFEGHADLEFTHLPQKDQSEVFEDIGQWAYDVVLFYNLTQKISDKRRENFLALTDRGVGIFVLHHALGSFNEWPEFKRIAGGKFMMYPQKEDDGKEYARSVAGGGDPAMKIQIADKEHPITRGLEEFAVPEEFYANMWFAPDNHVLLTTDHPKNDKTIGWVRQYRKSRVCTFQPGHGSPLYDHPTYRELMVRGIRWTAARA